MGSTFSLENHSPREVSLVDSLVGESLKPPPYVWLFPRRANVFITAATVFADYKFLQMRCNQITESADSEKIINEMWDAAHERNAKYLYDKFVSLRALWVKLGQYLSSRADIMPKSYLNHLSKCQDAIPPRPFAQVKVQIQQELATRPLEQVFQYIHEEPLACASIAQVHKAKLLNGDDVVIKIQHPNVAGELLQDLKNLETIGDTIRYLDADFDFTPVVREWAREVPKELDFRKEALNMKRVQQNLAPLFGLPEDSLGVNVVLADVIDDLVTEKMLVMKFVNGFKVNDREALETNSIDRASIIRHITRAYANQIFVDGFYSGDPHPGNILIDVERKIPVLLDFGLTKEVSDDIKRNFAKLIVAADEQDIQGIMTALDGVGLRLRPDVPFDIALLVRYFFRDAKGQEEAQSESRQRREDYKKREAAKNKGLYKGDKVDVTTKNMFGFKSVSKGEVLSVTQDEAMIRFTDGHEKLTDKETIKVQSSRSPIDAWPDAFIFFDRVLGLLRGLTASLDVTQSYLDVMTPYARLALTKYSTVENQETAGVSGIDLSKDKCVSELLESLIKTGEVLGCQVCVIQDGKPVVDLCAGVQDPYEKRPVSPDTLFCSFSVTKAITATCIHMLVQDGLLDLNRPIADYWPEFACHGKESITTAHVLRHEAGLSSAGLEDLTREPFSVCNSGYMHSLMASAVPDSPPGSSTKYHALSFGWILSGLLSHVTQMSIGKYLEQKISRVLDIEDEFMIGLGADGFERYNDAHRLATLVLMKEQSQPSAAPKQESRTETAAGDESSTQDSDETIDSESQRRPLQAPSLLMNPTFFNNPRIREAVLPAANGHFSARALAKFYSALLNSKKQQRKPRTDALFEYDDGIVHLLNPSGPERDDVTLQGDSLLQEESGIFRNGYIIFPAAQQDGTNSKSFWFGHSGLRGSIAVCNPETKTAVAITLNRLSLKNDATRTILLKIVTSLNLPKPSAFKGQ